MADEREATREIDWDEQPSEEWAEAWVMQNLESKIKLFGQQWYIFLDEREQDGFKIITGIPVSRFAKLFRDAIKLQIYEERFSIEKLVEFSRERGYNLEQDLETLKANSG